MAVNVVTITNLSNDLGFTRWNWIPLLASGVLEDANAIPYGPIPDHLVPANEFQVAAETSTCSLIAPWGGFADPFTEFLLGGGTSGSLIGALNGLNIVERSFLQKLTAEYGLGREYLGPEFGYCLGKHFKEKVYSAVSAQNVFNLVTVGQSEEDLIWRSRWERFYVNHGKIIGFEAISGMSYKITIPTNATNTSVGDVDFSALNEEITLYTLLDGDSTTFKVDKVVGVVEAIEVYVTQISIESSDSPTHFALDYFTLSSSWLIQDPYLLDGLLSNISQSDTPTGSEEFFRTDQNQIVSNGSFTGVYIRTLPVSSPTTPP